MLGKIQKYHQVNVFQTPLKTFINLEHESVKLADSIDCKAVEDEFKGYFAELGHPSVPIRRMVGLMLLKLSIDLNADECCKETEVMVDTTVQEKNITFPTDVKLTRKVITHCLKISRKERITLRRTYTRELKKLYLQTRFMNHSKRKREGLKAKKRLQTIGKALVNDLTRKMDSHKREVYLKDLIVYSRMLTQKRKYSNKIYCFHEPKAQCIAKGKEHKQFELGNKSSIVKTKTGVIVDALALEGNPFDGHTLPDQLEQIKRLSGMTVKNAVVDRGYRGRKWIDETKVEIPGSGKPKDSYYIKQKTRNKFRRSAGIEPVIDHLKQDQRMQRNYLKGTMGYAINTMFAATSYNLKHRLNNVILVLKTKYKILTAEIFNILNPLQNGQTFMPVMSGFSK